MKKIFLLFMGVLFLSFGEVLAQEHYDVDTYKELKRGDTSYDG